MRAFWPPSLQQIVPLAVLLCLIGGWSLFMSFVNLDETIAEISTTDREQTLWTATQIEFTLSEFRSDVITARHVPDSGAAGRIRMSFDILYSRLSQVGERQIQVILEQAEADYVVPGLLLIRDTMADIVDNSPELGDAELLRLYELASEAQRSWHPYKFVMLEAARNDRLAKLESVALALTTVRNHLLFGLIAAIGAGFAILLSSAFARKNSELLNQITRDALTGCYSRQGFEKIVAKKLKRNEKLSIAVVDINQLKLINDTMGHAEGDAYIRRVGQILKDGFRKEDCVARVGGDEFWIAANTHVDIVADKLTDIDRKLRSDRSTDHTQPIGHGIAFGVVPLAEHDGVDAAISIADGRMYERKRTTRSRLADLVPNPST